MPVTITIDEEAYEILQCLQEEGESLSNVIIRQFKRERNAERIREAIEKNPLSSETLDALREAVRLSRLDMPREV